MKKIKKTAKISFLVLDWLADIAIDNLKIIGRNISLFLGLTLSLLGLLSFESDKYCDGNAANYLSCTRPTTYYYYDWWNVVLIILGVFLIVLWLLKKKSSGS